MAAGPQRGMDARHPSTFVVGSRGRDRSVAATLRVDLGPENTHKGG